MDSSFSNGLQLNGMSSATSDVIWIMIIFLLILVLVIGYAFIQRLINLNKKISIPKNKTSKSKGF